VRGVTFKPSDLVDSDAPESVACLRTKNVQSVLDDTDLLYIPRRLVRRDEQFVGEGDTIISVANSWHLIGKASRAHNLTQAVVVGAFIGILRPKDARLDAYFLYRWFTSPHVQERVRRLSRQTTNIANLDVQRMLKMVLDVPPLHEQRRIAAILDQADELRAKRRRTLALLDESKAALFDELFVNRTWPLGRVRELLASSSYGSAKKAGPSGRLPMLRMGNISYEGRLDTTDLKYVDLAENEVEKYTVQRGDVLFNRTNSRERVGKTAMFDLDADMAYAGYLIRLRVKPDHRPEYLAAFMNTARTKSVLRSMAKSIVGMANINAKEVGNMKVPIPSLEAQDDFVDRARSINHARALAEAHLAHLDELFSSLQHRAFTGKL
jgi:type I restriction enzyme S subunit